MVLSDAIHVKPDLSCFTLGATSLYPSWYAVLSQSLLTDAYDWSVDTDSNDFLLQIDSP